MLAERYVMCLQVLACCEAVLPGHSRPCKDRKRSRLWLTSEAASDGPAEGRKSKNPHGTRAATRVAYDVARVYC